MSRENLVSVLCWCCGAVVLVLCCGADAGVVVLVLVLWCWCCGAGAVVAGRLGFVVDQFYTHSTILYLPPEFWCLDTS
jgi:hypothetical protein